jgi:hypothetical protein
MADWRIEAKQRRLERKRTEWLLFEIWVQQRADLNGRCEELDPTFAWRRGREVLKRLILECLRIHGSCFERRGREKERKLGELKRWWHFSSKRKCRVEEDLLERRGQFVDPLPVPGRMDGLAR